MFKTYLEDPEELENKLNKIIAYILELAKNEPKDENRKSLYNLVGYLKSD